MPKEVFQYMSERQTVGKPQGEEITRYLQVFSRLRHDDLGVLSNNRDAVSEELSVFKDYLQAQEGVTPSRLFLCADYVRVAIFEKYIKFADTFLQEGDIPSFRFFFDTGFGISNVCGRLMAGELGVGGEADEFITRYISEESEVIDPKDPIGSAVEEYVTVTGDVSKTSRFLREDPTGFSALDTFIAELKKGSGIQESVQAEEYILAGAELARDIYKELYEIAYSLYPQSQS